MLTGLPTYSVYREEPQTELSASCTMPSMFMPLVNLRDTLASSFYQWTETCPIQSELRNLVPHLPQTDLTGNLSGSFPTIPTQGQPPLFSVEHNLSCYLHLYSRLQLRFAQISAFYPSLQSKINFGLQGQSCGTMIRSCLALASLSSS